ncbi:DUF5522 domain-containing protein [Flaviaesturariibacter terrae]
MNKPLVEGEDYYWNKQGYVVLTEQHHRKRGYCCGMGCQHCPYEYEAVPEPRRSELLDQRRKNEQQES